VCEFHFELILCGAYAVAGAYAGDDAGDDASAGAVVLIFQNDCCGCTLHFDVLRTECYLNATVFPVLMVLFKSMTLSLFFLSLYLALACSICLLRACITLDCASGNLLLLAVCAFSFPDELLS
jgi:hypothetical protein